MASKSKILLTDKANPWLHGFRDPVAKLNAYNSNMELIPLTKDGENRLVVGDFVTNKILGYKGINVEFQIEVNEQIIAVSYFYADQGTFSGIPCLAFAVDGYIFIYQNNQPKFKFPLPKIEVHPKELEVWQSFQEGSKEGMLKMIEQWNKLRTEQQINLSSKALDVLILTKASKQHDLIKQHLSGGIESLQSLDTPTCLSKINTHQEGDYATSQLVMGTEFKKLYILDAQGYQVQKQYELASTPLSIICTGILQGDHRIIITTRDSQIQFIRNGQHEPIIIDLLSKPIQSILVNSSIIVGTMNETIACYNFKGSKQYSFKLTSDIVAVESMASGNSKNLQGYLVGLENSELRIYEGKQLVHILQLEGMVMGMKFGTFGREEGMLIMILKNKGLDIRILQRGFNFQSFRSQNALHNDEEERPLKIKRTNLFIEQTERERMNPVPIYRCLEKDLLKLRLKTAQSYLKILEENSMGGGSGSVNASSNLRIQAEIQGIGPVFKIQMKIENLSNESLQNLVVSYMYDQKLYRLTKPVFTIPFLLPHVSFPLNTEILSIDKNGAADQIKVIITEKNKQIPLIGAIIQVPLSEIRE